MNLTYAYISVGDVTYEILHNKCNAPTTIIMFSLIFAESEPTKYLRRPSVS
jgi:hypothetical protein